MDLSAKVADQSLKARATRVAAIAAVYADEVDKAGRFPAEAIDALKSERLMGIQIPVDCGGEGRSTSEIAELCTIIAQSCAASAMIFAMHQIKVSSLVSHGVDAGWHRTFMQKICSEQLLIGSATTEGGIGGNLRNSICAIEVEGDRCRLEKDATVISYGKHADAILITSRSHKDAPPTDQVMTAFLKDQYTLEQTHVWDTLGMRGTCSDGFLFKGEAPAEQILPKPYAEIAAQSMLATRISCGAHSGMASRSMRSPRPRPSSAPPHARRPAQLLRASCISQKCRASCRSFARISKPAWAAMSRR